MDENQNPDAAPPASPYEVTAQGLADAILGTSLTLSPETLHPSHPESTRALLAAQLRAAGVHLALAEGRRGRSVSKDQQRSFLICLAAGLGVHQSADIVGCTAMALYGIRRREKSFREAWDDALEASLDPIDARLTSIALHGNPESMATVRSAEILARGRRRSERRDLAQQMALEMQQSNAEGETQTIRVVLRTPIPD